MYEHRVSPVFCTYSRSSSNDVGRLDVPRKLAMKTCLNSSHEPIDPGTRLLSQAHAASLRCSCNSYRALSLEPPLIVTAVTKSSSQILGSSCPLNLTMPSLILSPFGKGVVQMYRLKLFTLVMGVESTSFVLHASCIDSVLCQSMPKFTIDRLHDVAPVHGCMCCWLMSMLL
jgi:hypothetical protein